MPATERPKADLKEVDSAELANELEQLAEHLGIDLSLADDAETEKILNALDKSLSDEIVDTREKNTE